MTVGELKARLAKCPAAHDDLEVKVWLPGTRISIDGWVGYSMLSTPRKAADAPPCIMVEGSVDPGSALGIMED